VGSSYTFKIRLDMMRAKGYLMSMKLNTIRIQREHIVSFRCTVPEYNRLKLKANMYAEGKLSDYVRHCAMNYVILKKDLVGSARHKKRSKRRR
jgi:hypothetical protein